MSDDTPRRHSLRQWAPWPDELEKLVEQLDYNDAWVWHLYEEYDRDFAADDHGRQVAIGGGTTLACTIRHNNSYPPHEARSTRFTWPVPATTWNRDSWMMWLLDCIGDVERHERGEFFRLVHKHDVRIGATLTIPDQEWVERPFAPLHGPGDDQNRLHRWAPTDRRRISFRGEVNPA